MIKEKKDDQGEEKQKYYEIQREFSFDSKGNKFFDAKGGRKQKSKKADLVVRRWEKDKAGKICFLHPVIMELKRYSLYDFDISTGDVKIIGSNIAEITRDIQNLKVFCEKWKDLETGVYKEHDYCLPYLLIWGEEDEFAGVDSEIKTKTLSCELSVPKDNICLKWMPLIIDESPKVTKWLWLALIEIKCKEN